MDKENDMTNKVEDSEKDDMIINFVIKYLD